MTVEDKEVVPAYQIRIIEGKNPTKSSMAAKSLMNEGIRPINKVVDVTNYILLYSDNHYMHLTTTN